MQRRRIGIGVGLITAAAGAVAGPAASAEPTPAGTVTVSRACYVNTAKAAAKITINGSGWQAGATVDLSDKLGKLTATATAGANGDFSVTAPAPVVDTYAQSQVTDTIIASNDDDPAQPGSATGSTASSPPFLTTNFAVLQSGNKTNPAKKTIFHFSGFAPNRTIYGHYLNASGKWLRNVAFGRATGACGLRQVTAYEYPGGRPQRGTYTVQFDDSASYRPATQPQYRLSFKVYTEA